MAVLAYRGQLDEAVVDARNRISAIATASAAVKKSLRFRRLLVDVLLPMGNKLNAADKRKGGAKGVKMNGLAKLAQTKNSAGVSLLRFAVETLLKDVGGQFERRALGCPPVRVAARCDRRRQIS